MMDSCANQKDSDFLQKNRILAEKVSTLQQKLDRVGNNLTIQERIIDKINQISQLSRQINCLDLERIASVCIEQIPQLISASVASLYTYDSQKKVLHLLRHNHPYSIAKVFVLAEHPQLPMSLAIKEKKLLLIKDFSEWECRKQTAVTRPFARNYNSNSCIIAPLMSGQRILGVLNLADKIDGNAFENNVDLPPVQLLCEIIGSAMSNIELYEEVQKQALTDGMTNLLNHRAFYDVLDKEVNRTQRYGNNLSLLMIDLDSLKQINDQHGHRAGDAVLLHVAEQILACIRDTDVAARYGGDEFAIILPNTSLSDAMHLAERMAKKISRKPVRTNNKELNVSVSIGLGQYSQYQSVEDFMNKTDAAMFNAKTAGKNRVHVCK